MAPAPTSLVRLRPHGGLAAWRRGEALAVQLQRRLSEEVRAGGLKCHLPEKPLGQVVESGCRGQAAMNSAMRGPSFHHFHHFKEGFSGVPC